MRQAVLGALFACWLAGCCTHGASRIGSPQATSLPSGFGSRSSVRPMRPEACRRALRARGAAFRGLPRSAAPGVRQPIRLSSALGGVRFEARDGRGRHEIVDCHLAVALLAWAEDLRRAGVVRVVHYSTYRAGARIGRSSKVSGHAHALAIDAAGFELEDGRQLTVVDDWAPREPHGDPCRRRLRGGQDAKLLRDVVCKAVRRDLFQVVLTPHHDRAHQDHVHMELSRRGTWSFVH